MGAKVGGGGAVWGAERGDGVEGGGHGARDRSPRPLTPREMMLGKVAGGPSRWTAQTTLKGVGEKRVGWDEMQDDASVRKTRERET